MSLSYDITHARRIMQGTSLALWLGSHATSCSEGAHGRTLSCAVVVVVVVVVAAGGGGIGAQGG